MVTLILSLPQRVLMWLVRGYRVLLSPWLQTGCRYEPSCSGYSLQAIERHGAIVGTYLTLHRLVRCHPLCEGGHDPVPEQTPRLFRGVVRGKPRAAGSPSSTSLDNQTSP
jgi:putative membrane protein insertion efficiency factor